MKILFVLASALLLGLSSCQEDAKKQPWFVFAAEYVEADELLIKHAAEQRQSFIQDSAARDDAQLRLLNVPAPPLSRLDGLLNSNETVARKIGLVNIMLRKINDDRLVESILKTYRFEDDMMTKFYSQRCFLDLSDSQLKSFEDPLIKILSLEENEVAIITAMPTLIRLDRSKVKPLFTRYLTSGTKGLRAAALVSLKKMGTEVFDEVYNQLSPENQKTLKHLTSRSSE